MAKLISKTYGDALFDLAQDEGKVESLFEEVRILSQVMDENMQLHTLMSHPRISKEEKIKIVEEMLEGQVSEELKGFVVLLVRNGRFDEIRQIFSYFIHLVKEYKKIGIAYVSTVVELKDDQKQQLVDKLLATTKYESFEMQYQIDKSLIGGMVIRINDRVVDSSIKTKLEDLSQDLMQIQLA